MHCFKKTNWFLHVKLATKSQFHVRITLKLQIFLKSNKWSMNSTFICIWLSTIHITITNRTSLHCMSHECISDQTASSTRPLHADAYTALDFYWNTTFSRCNVSDSDSRSPKRKHNGDNRLQELDDLHAVEVWCRMWCLTIPMILPIQHHVLDIAEECNC